MRHCRERNRNSQKLNLFESFGGRHMIDFCLQILESFDFLRRQCLPKKKEIFLRFMHAFGVKSIGWNSAELFRKLLRKVRNLARNSKQNTFTSRLSLTCNAIKYSKLVSKLPTDSSTLDLTHPEPGKNYQ